MVRHLKQTNRQQAQILWGRLFENIRCHREIELKKNMINKIGNSKDFKNISTTYFFLHNLRPSFRSSVTPASWSSAARHVGLVIYFTELKKTLPLEFSVLFEVKLPYEPVCPFRSVVGWLVCLVIIFLKSGKLHVSSLGLIIWSLPKCIYYQSTASFVIGRRIARWMVLVSGKLTPTPRLLLGVQEKLWFFFSIHLNRSTLWLPLRKRSARL